METFLVIGSVVAALASITAVGIKKLGIDMFLISALAFGAFAIGIVTMRESVRLYQTAESASQFRLTHYGEQE